MRSCVDPHVMPRGVEALWGRCHPAQEACLVDGVARKPPQELHSVHEDFLTTLQLYQDRTSLAPELLGRHKSPL